MSCTEALASIDWHVLGTAERAPGHKQWGGGRAEKEEKREEEKEAKRPTRGEALLVRKQLKSEECALISSHFLSEFH